MQLQRYPQPVYEVGDCLAEVEFDPGSERRDDDSSQCRGLLHDQSWRAELNLDCGHARLAKDRQGHATGATIFKAECAREPVLDDLSKLATCNGFVMKS